MITAYEWHGMMQDPKLKRPSVDERAYALFEAYRAYLDGQKEPKK
jgi:hypothetical protein